MAGIGVRPRSRLAGPEHGGEEALKATAVLAASGRFLLPLYYFDVETTGDDPAADRVVTIQYQPLGDDLRPAGLFQVMAEWEWGEKQVIQMALEKGVLEPTWDFVPVGNRLRFDLTFLIERATKWKLIDWDLGKLKYYWFTKPFIDMGPLLVMLNRGRFTGSSLGTFADKESGRLVPKMYREGRYPDIIGYVTRERDAAVELLLEIQRVLGTFGDERRLKGARPSE